MSLRAYGLFVDTISSVIPTLGLPLGGDLALTAGTDAVFGVELVVLRNGLILELPNSAEAKEG